MEVRRVKLSEVIDARERRMTEILALTRRYNKPVLWFGMDIDGALRNTPLIRQAFDKGLNDIRAQFMRINAEILFEKVIHDFTGNEAFFITDLDAETMKKLAVELEDEGGLGAIYRIEVYKLPSQKARINALVRGSSKVSVYPEMIDREELGIAPRKCPVCGDATGKCSLQIGHSSESCHAATKRILVEGVYGQHASMISEKASQALLFESAVTPKAGLIDRNNKGAFQTKDFYMILIGSSALFLYFQECVQAGQLTADQNPEDTFAYLREIGKKAERRMMLATGGVAIRKGALFVLGFLCVAAGRVAAKKLGCPKIEDPKEAARVNSEIAYVPEGDNFLAEYFDPFGTPEVIAAECAAIAKGITERDFAGITMENARTFGEKIYAEYGITGIRGELEAGLPTVINYGLPALEQFLSEKRSYDEAGALTLLALIGYSTDTSLIECSDLKTQQEMQKQAAELFSAFSYSSKATRTDMLMSLDEDYIKSGLKPKGSGDLLAACFFLYFLKNIH